MSTRFDQQIGIDFKNAAFAVVSGAISGVTPKVSEWIRVLNVDTIAFRLTTTSTANGVWTAETAEDYKGFNAMALPPANVSPAFPTGTTQDQVTTLTIPCRRHSHIRLTFTPSAGAGNANADTGLIVGRPVIIERKDLAAVYFDQSNATQAGQWAVDYAATYYDREKDAAGPQIDNLADPPLYSAAIDHLNAAITFAATTSGLANFMKRFGALEYAAIRAKFIPTAGAGRLRAIFNSKG